MANKRTVRQIISTDEYMRRLIFSLLANSIDEYSRLGDYREVITPDDIPSDMPEARKIMKALIIADEKTIAPTESNVISIMALELNMQQTSANDIVHNIMGYATTDRAVDNLSVMVGMDVQRRRIETAMETAVDTLQNGEGKLSDRLDEAVHALSEVSHTSDESVRTTQAEGIDRHKAVLRQRVANRKAGISNGPSLKFLGFVGERNKETGLWKEGCEGKVPVLRWGATTLITAKQGRGKTTFAQTWAEYNAWKLGIDVLYMHNETDQEDLQDRSITRATLIPTDYLKNVLDIDNDKDPATVKVNKYYERLANTKAEITYLYCPGWNVYKINLAVSLARRLADRKGHGLLVIVDYYNLIDFSNMPGERAQQLGTVAVKMRDAVKIENVKSRNAGGVGLHMIVLAQETEEKTTGEISPFGSKEIAHYSQLHVSIQKTIAEMDTTMGGAKNAIGGTRFWSRKGEYSHETKLKILKANYDSPGTVDVWVENAMVTVRDPNPPVQSVEL